ncbi:MAG: sigma-54-dependent Fis family transcriptional regulator [Planctomycetes bacterium]|nr:sigma-54-dependent Fis family transcriptional regulator [Planctomycetota bacterium]
MGKRRILVADDDGGLRRIVKHNLTQRGYEVLLASDGAEALQQFKDDPPDLTVADLKMPGLDGLELLREIKRLDKAAIVVMITGHATVQTAVEAMKAGAYDYIVKPFDREELQFVVDKALASKSIDDGTLRLRQQRADRASLTNVVGDCGRMQKIFDQVARIALTDSTVLIHGESGTGKELVARAIHTASARGQKPFVAVNCTAIPENLLESELFGHTQGAFTGATADKRGKFEAAHGGTVFLDEVVDLHPGLQVKLLRVLQEKTVDKVGVATPIPVDVRVVAATNRDLGQALRSGQLREDLFYRLSVIPLRLPPLRERKEDIPALVEHFVRKHGGGHPCRVEPDVLQAFDRHGWPGNVRELENAIQQALAMRAQPDRITLADIPDPIKAPRIVAPLNLHIPDEGLKMDEVEKQLIALALQQAGGNQTRAAELLGMTRQALIRRLRKHGLSEQ